MGMHPWMRFCVEYVHPCICIPVCACGDQMSSSGFRDFLSLLALFQGFPISFGKIPPLFSNVGFGSLTESDVQQLAGQYG